VHVGALGLRAASDRLVLQAARDDDRVLVSADTDFGTLLAASHEPGPSVVLVRRVIGRRVEQLAGLLVANLPQVADDLRDGSIVVIGDDSVRVRRLPIG
jgi:predicted nuclease of predicted toxin-antitoxin system